MPEAIKRILELEDDTRFCIALSDFVFHKNVDFVHLTQSEQIVYCVDDLEREVNNGGFALFFLNLAGDHIYETMRACEIIGAFYTLKLLQRAIKIFPESRPSLVRDERARQTEELSLQAKDELGQLDEEFFKYRDNLALLIRRFVEKNQNDFPDASYGGIA